MTHDGNYQGDESAALGRIKSFVERVEAVEAEIKDRNEDKSEIYKEAKGEGFNVKALKALVRERRADPDEMSELEITMDLYRKALAQ